MNKFIQDQSKGILKNLGFETDFSAYEGLERCIIIHLQTEVVLKKISLTKEVLEGFNPQWKTIRSSISELIQDVSIYLESPLNCHFPSDIQRVTTEKRNMKKEISEMEEILLSGKSTAVSKSKLNRALIRIAFFANAIKSILEYREEDEILNTIDLYQ